MDAATPNPKKPRISRRLLSHFTLTLSVLLALSFVTLAVVGPATQEADAVIPLLAIGAGMLIGGAIVALADYIWDERTHDPAGLTQAEYATWIKTVMESSAGTAKAWAQSDAENMDALTYLWARQGEWGARQLFISQKESNTTTMYSMAESFENTQMYSDMAEFLGHGAEMYDTVYSPWESIGLNFVEAYAGMSYGMMTSSSTMEGSTSSEPYVNFEHGYKLNRGSSNLYWFTNKTSFTPVAAYPSASPAVNYTFTLYNEENETVWSKALFKMSYETFNMGDLGLPEGFYYYTTSGGADTSLTTTFLMADYVYHRESAILVPTFVMGSDADGEQPWKLLSICISGRAMVADGSEITDLTYYKQAIEVSGGGHYYIGQAPYHPANPQDRIITLQQLVTSADTVRTSVSSMAQSYYNSLVALGEAGADYGLPLMLMPDPSQMEDMSWEEIYLMWLAYIEAASEYYYDHSGDLGPSQVNISAESLKLRVRGSIVNSTGSTLFDNNTIWTPFVTTQSVNLTIGLNSWTSSAYGTIWGSASSIANLTYVQNGKLVNLDPGYQLWIQEIMYDGNATDSIALNVTSIDLIVPDAPDDMPGPGAGDTTTDLEWLIDRWYYMAIIGGVLCFLAAISTRNMPILVAGIVLVAAGALGWYMAEDHSLWEWVLEMRPENLTAWIQGMR